MHATVLHDLDIAEHAILLLMVIGAGILGYLATKQGRTRERALGRPDLSALHTPERRRGFKLRRRATAIAILGTPIIQLAVFLSYKSALSVLIPWASMLALIVFATLPLRSTFTRNIKIDKGYVIVTLLLAASLLPPATPPLLLIRFFFFDLLSLPIIAIVVGRIRRNAGGPE